MNNLLHKSSLWLAIALLACLLPMPYGYYTLVRFIAMIFFGCCAYYFYKIQKIPLCIIAGSLSMLFQPFFKIVLGKTMWNVVDVIVAIILVVWYKKQNL